MIRYIITLTRVYVINTYKHILFCSHEEIVERKER